MELPEGTPDAKIFSKAKGSMPGPHEPVEVQANGASTGEIGSMWSPKSANGVSKVANGCNGSIKKEQAQPNGTSSVPQAAHGEDPKGIRPDDEGSAPLSDSAAPAKDPPTSGAVPGAATTPQGAPPADLTPAQRQAIRDLESIVARIRQLDTAGWFQVPVTEAVAPNYYKIIKQPMCFQASCCS